MSEGMTTGRRWRLWGLLAEFNSADELAEACRAARSDGYTKLDAYSPFPSEELSEALELPRSKMPLIVLIGGLCGGIGAFLLQYWVSAIAYPINVGGRPFNSWPAFIPVMFELTVLIGGISAIVGMLALNGLPMPYHPVFNVPEFRRASRDRFFLSVEATDPKFDLETTKQFLQRLTPHEVSEVDD